MIRLFSTFLLVLGITINASSQDGFEIEIKLDNYEQDTLLLAYFYADKQLIRDTLTAKEKGEFVVKGDEQLAPGVYMLILRPDNNWVQFMVNEDNQFFKISMDANDLRNMKFKGSRDNEAFKEYVSFLAKKRPIADKLNQELAKAEKKGEKNVEATKALAELDKEVQEYQQKIVNDNPDFITSKIIKSNFEIDIPDFDGTEQEQKEKTFKYYKKHYFDFLELGSRHTLRTPFIHQRVMYYMDKLTGPMPDSINRSLDYVLSEMKPAEETFKYYLSWFLNHYGNSKIVGYDAIYVHLVDNYYAKGLAPWVKEENLSKMMGEARMIKPLLIGKTAPNAVLYEEDGTAFSLKDLDADYKVLFFWSPDCGHCKKATPALLKFAENAQEKGIAVIAICNDLKEKTKKCWDNIEEKGMQNLINLADEKHRSRFKVKYYVKSTPKIFVLDRDMKILIKKIGTEQLESVMDEIIAIKKQQEAGE